MLTGNWLFDPKDSDDHTFEDDHLSQMMEITGEEFTSDFLEKCHLRDEFFNKDGQSLGP